MKTLLLILILSITAVPCPQVVRTLYGRVTHNGQGVSAMSLFLVGAATGLKARTSTFGYYQFEVTSCDSEFIFAGISKKHYFVINVVLPQHDNEVNIFIP